MEKFIDWYVKMQLKLAYFANICKYAFEILIISNNNKLNGCEKLMKRINKRGIHWLFNIAKFCARIKKKNCKKNT